MNTAIPHRKSDTLADQPPAASKPQEKSPVSAGKPVSHPEKGPQTAELEARIAELTETAQRLQAEFENYQKRTAREKAAWAQAEKARVVLGMLPIFESIAKGAEHAHGKEKEGLLGLVRQYAQWMESEGIRPLETVGKPFDPLFHDCVLQGNDPKKPEQVVLEELQKGYVLGNTVLRHAKVKVNILPVQDAPEKKAREADDAASV
jgi:molecular chaperone GrpE